MISDDILKLLVCPSCKTNVVTDNDRIVCVKCGRKYPVIDGIPVMLTEEEELNEKTKEKQ